MLGNVVFCVSQAGVARGVRYVAYVPRIYIYAEQRCNVHRWASVGTTLKTTFNNVATLAMAFDIELFCIRVFHDQLEPGILGEPRSSPGPFQPFDFFDAFMAL